MVKWDADKDRQLFLGVLAHMDIKVGKDLSEHLAAVIGEGCTPKAVLRRIENLQAPTKPKKQPTAPSAGNRSSPDNMTTTQSADTKIKSEEKANTKANGRKRGRSEKEPEGMNKKTETADGDGEMEDDDEI